MKKLLAIGMAVGCVVALSGCGNVDPDVELIVEEVNIVIPLSDIEELGDGCIEYTFRGVNDTACDDYEIRTIPEYVPTRRGEYIPREERVR